MNILKNWTNLIAKVRALNRKSLEAIRFAIFGIIVADIFGLWYLLGWKRLSAALLIFLILALVIILLLERNLPLEPSKKVKKEVKPKMQNEQTETQEQPEEYLDLAQNQPKEQPREQEKSEGIFSNMDLGLGNPDEYQDRMENALGTL